MLQAASLPNRIKEFYERVSIEREAALIDLPALYADDVHFINPVVDQHGLAAFREVLSAAGLPSHRRYSGGSDVAAACGQLAASMV